MSGTADITPFAQMPANYLPASTLTKTKGCIIVAIALIAMTAGVIAITQLKYHSGNHFLQIMAVGLPLGALILLTGTAVTVSKDRADKRWSNTKWQIAADFYKFAQTLPEEEKQETLKKYCLLLDKWSVPTREFGKTVANKIIIDEFMKGLDASAQTEIRDEIENTDQIHKL